MRLVLIGLLLLPVGCGNAADAQYVAQFRADGIRSCMRGEGLMRAQWAVRPELIPRTCDCIVTAYMEGKTRSELAHLTVEDQLRARERCSGGAPLGAGPGEAEAMDALANSVIDRISNGANANMHAGKK